MIDQLRHFLLVVEHGTFTAAARRAHISQPALTASIQRLETVFGARLLHRGPGGATATASGAALVPRARAAIAAVADGMRVVAEVEGLHRGEVRIGAGATVCTYLLPKVLAEFRRRHPEVRFLLRESTPEPIVEWLEAGEIDLAIIPSDHGEPWRVDPAVLVAAPGTDPASAPFVTFPRGSTTRALLDEHFPDANVVMELNSIAAVKANVRAGIGIALVSRSAVETDVAAGRLVLVPHGKTIVRNLAIVHRGIDRLAPAAAAFRELLLRSRDPIPPKKRPRRR